MSKNWTWWINGELFTGARATIPVSDHGLTVGDGCFETTKVVRGEAFAMRRHLARLRRSLAGLLLELPLSDAELRDAVADTLAANPGSGIVRITVTAGSGPLGSGRDATPPTVIIGVSADPGWADSTAVITVPWPRNERGALAGVKSTSYAENVIAVCRAHEAEASEAIFANLVGDLCEGTGSNIFVEHEGQLITPPLSSGCLAGVTRELVLETATVVERSVPIDLLRTTSEAFLTSSTRDVMAIHNIDGRDLPAGPLTAAAAAAFAAVMAENVDP